MLGNYDAQELGIDGRKGGHLLRKSDVSSGLIAQPGQAAGVDPLAEPMPFDRLFKLGEQSNIRLRFVRRRASNPTTCDVWSTMRKGRKGVGSFWCSVN